GGGRPDRECRDRRARSGLGDSGRAGGAHVRPLLSSPRRITSLRLRAGAVHQPPDRRPSRRGPVGRVPARRAHPLRGPTAGRGRAEGRSASRGGGPIGSAALVQIRRPSRLRAARTPPGVWEFWAGARNTASAPPPNPRPDWALAELVQAPRVVG